MAAPPVVSGLDALARLDALPYLNLDRLAGGQSSRDRTGGNNDFGNFLRVDGNGDHVLLDERGPGEVTRLWFTSVPDATRIKMWFDGESSPRVNLRLLDLVNGVDPRFPTPLVAGPSASSGGDVSYVPLPFASSLKIAISGADNAYYNVGYQRLPANAAVTTWTGSENAASAIDAWTHLGTDPKPASANIVVTGTTNVGAGSAATLLDIAGQGPRSISSIKLKVPGITAPTQTTVTDDGRAFTGSSSFTLSLGAASANALTLSRRLDYGIGNQKANVYIDGVKAGVWFDPGVDTANRWRDSTFAIPTSFTTGKTSVRVRIEFVSSDVDWNEFRYQAIVNGQVTDTLDVGKAASETSHAYTIVGAAWAGTQTFNYPGAIDLTARDILNHTRLRISWDNQSTPAVDAPLGSFFALGEFGPANVRSLPVGMDSSGQLYVYFPMPFRSRARIELVNDRGVALNNISFEIQHSAFAGNFADVGYFKTAFNISAPTITGTDIQILNAAGAGKLVGVVESIAGETSRYYLEGDERISVDGSSTPAIQGTGTEDFFDGAFYFSSGPYSNALSGNASHLVEQIGTTGNYSDKTAAYRLFLGDNAVNFRNGIHVSIEHGATNDSLPDVWTLAYYYQQPLARASVTDTLDVGSTPSESSHQYAITTPTFQGTRTYTYEGDADTVKVTDNGRAFKGSSTFNLALDPSNTGAILRRRLDQNVADQTANVFVDGQLVGIWSHAGANTSHAWADDDFLIPAAFTAGKSTIRVKIVFVSAAIDWNEFRYTALSILPADVTAPRVSASAFTFETSQAAVFSFSESLSTIPKSADVAVQNLTTGATISPSTYALTMIGNALTIRFTTVLPDGNYKLTIAADAAADAAGNLLAAAPTLDFFVLAGDVNHDRVVNFDDLVLIAQNYSKTGKVFSEGNLDYSAGGEINFDDLVILAQRYNTTLAAPSALVAAKVMTSVPKKRDASSRPATVLA